MEFNNDDYFFACNFMKFMMIDFKEYWQPYFSELIKNRKPLFTNNIRRKVKHTLVVNNSFHLRYKHWFKEAERNIENFKVLVEQIVCDMLPNDFSMEEFINYCCQMGIVASCGYIDEIFEAPNHVMSRFIQSLYKLREDGLFTDDYYSNLDRWALSGKQDGETQYRSSESSESESVYEGGSSGVDSDKSDENLDKEDHVDIGYAITYSESRHIPQDEIRPDLLESILNWNESVNHPMCSYAVSVTPQPSNGCSFMLKLNDASGQAQQQELIGETIEKRQRDDDVLNLYKSCNFEKPGKPLQDEGKLTEEFLDSVFVDEPTGQMQLHEHKKLCRTLDSSNLVDKSKEQMQSYEDTVAQRKTKSEITDEQTERKISLEKRNSDCMDDALLSCSQKPLKKYKSEPSCRTLSSYTRLQNVQGTAFSIVNRTDINSSMGNKRLNIFSKEETDNIDEGTNRNTNAIPKNSKFHHHAKSIKSDPLPRTETASLQRSTEFSVNESLVELRNIPSIEKTMVGKEVKSREDENLEETVSETMQITRSDKRRKITNCNDRASNELQKETSNQTNFCL